MMHTLLKRLGLLATGLLLVTLPQRASSAEIRPTPSLEQALAQLQVPPDWMATPPITWDTARPWQDARLEIRRRVSPRAARPAILVPTRLPERRVAVAAKLAEPIQAANRRPLHRVRQVH